ncbi:MAG: hypothetical protein IKS68_07590 [Mailhella sp.]|nr:hypothetical protein [Mailhella sp.]
MVKAYAAGTIGKRRRAAEKAQSLHAGRKTMWIPQDGETLGKDVSWDEIEEYFAAQKEPMHTVARHVVKRGKNTTSYTLPKERDTEKSYGNTAICGTPGTRMGTERISLPGWKRTADRRDPA